MTQVVLSRVDGVYVPEHDGLFIEARLLPQSRRQLIRYKVLRVLVRYDVPGENRSSTERTQVPPDLQLRRGDRVEVTLSEPQSIASAGPIRGAGRVVRRVFEDTRMAADSAPRTAGN